MQDGIIARWFMSGDGEQVSPSVPLAYGMSFSGTLLGQFLGMTITPMVAETSLEIGELACLYRNSEAPEHPVLTLLNPALFVPACIMLGNFFFNILFVILDYKAAPVLGT